MAHPGVPGTFKGRWRMASVEEPATALSLVRTGHDPDRLALDTRKAADLLGVSRQAVIDAIKRGSIPGYCLAGPKRMRWFVYADGIDPAYDRARQMAHESDRLRERLATVENALASQQAVAELRRESQALFERAMMLTTEATQLLVQAYQKSVEAQELAASFNRSSWVPTFLPGGD